MLLCKNNGLIKSGANNVDALSGRAFEPVFYFKDDSCLSLRAGCKGYGMRVALIIIKLPFFLKWRTGPSPQEIVLLFNCY